MTIQQDLAKCIEDTRRYINPQAANTLKPWIYYDIDQLISAIQRAIRVVHNQANGWEIHRNNGVSLEKIVLTYDCFTSADKDTARLTLGLS